MDERDESYKIAYGQLLQARCPKEKKTFCREKKNIMVAPTMFP
jgi:hypothetical protein